MMRFSGMHYGGMNAGWAIVCMAAVIVIIALVAWAIAFSSNRRGSRDDRGASCPGALVVLERLLADGDIDENEYRRRCDLLASASR